MGESLGGLVADLRRMYTPGLPRGLFWAIINHCNAVCTTCSFYLVPPPSHARVSLEDARHALELLNRSAFRFVSITGGEPLMNPEVFDICEEVTSQGMVVTYMPTNGLLVDRVAAERLRDAEVRVVGVSVEVPRSDGMGPTRKIPHLREVVVRAREHLDAAGVTNYAGILLSRATLDIRRLLEEVVDMGFEKVVFSYPQQTQASSYRAAADVVDVDLTAEQVEAMVGQIKAAKHDFRELGIYNTDGSLDDLVRFYQGVPRRYACWGGKRLFYLDWNLDLYQCFTLPKKYGNLRTMERLAMEEDSLCDLCTQQAFRDFGPWYAAADGAMAAKDLAVHGHPLRALRTLTEAKTVDGFRSLLEVRRAGFL